MTNKQKEFTARAWIRWTFGVLTAVAIGVVLSSYIVRDNLVSDCVRESVFKNIEASAWEQAAIQRREDGDKDTALFYKNTAYDIRLTIPISDDWNPEDGVLRGQLSEDRKVGCELAFPLPIPFVE